MQVFVQPVLLMFVFSLLMSDFFDTMGTMMAVGQQGDFVDEDGNVENTREILMVDSVGAIVGGFVGASSITSFAESTSGVVVGYLMMSDIGKIDWGSLEAAIPAFVTIMGIPFTYSITNGIGFGFITYVVVKVTQGHWRDVKPLMWIVSAAFLFTFVAFS